MCCTWASNGSPQSRVQRPAVVLQDDLLLHRLKLHNATFNSDGPARCSGTGSFLRYAAPTDSLPKNFCACRIPSASASTSSRLLYT